VASLSDTSVQCVPAQRRLRDSAPAREASAISWLVWAAVAFGALCRSASLGSPVDPGSRTAHSTWSRPGSDCRPGTRTRPARLWRSWCCPRRRSACTASGRRATGMSCARWSSSCSHAKPSDALLVLDPATFAFYTGRDLRNQSPQPPADTSVWVITPWSRHGDSPPEAIVQDLQVRRKRLDACESAGAAAFLFGPERAAGP